MAEDGETKWISTGQAARRLGCCHATVRRWCDSGKLSHWKTPTNQYKVAQHDVEAIIEKTVTLATLQLPQSEASFLNTD